MNLQETTHKRFNILTGQWILVSPHRAKRPWQGKKEKIPPGNRPEYDPECYLCPGNTRAERAKNPDYKDTFVFINDFQPILPDIEPAEMNEQDLLIAKNEIGLCKVICFSPRHDLALAKMEVDDIYKVVDVWIKEYQEIGNIDGINYVQIFENRGAIMGCSNPHPHGQIWSNSSIPDMPALETVRQREYFEKKKNCLLCDYLDLELKKKERIIFENDSFAVLVPFWAIWPFEVMLLPKQHIACISEMDETQKKDYADAILRLGIRYDNLFETPFPYSMGMHQKPTDGKDHPSWHFHSHYVPPLLRSATVKKFMVGYELLATPQRDITAESAAACLRKLPEIHYTRKK